jgi:hypothetical protein
MKQLEINGRQVLAVNVPECCENVKEHIEYCSLINGSWQDYLDRKYLWVNNYDIIADSNKPEAFAKVFGIGINLDFDFPEGLEPELDDWESLAKYVMWEKGLSGRVILLTEKTETNGKKC